MAIYGSTEGIIFISACIIINGVIPLFVGAILGPRTSHVLFYWHHNDRIDFMNKMNIKINER